MALFELPDFYMPWSARSNPNVARAREHTRAWAHEIGILEAGVWDAPTFDAADFARFTAGVHPRAAAGELELLTDWYVWLFYLDDDFEATKRAGDLAGAKAYAARLARLLPADPADGSAPDPETVVERALTDLWSRTAPTASSAWRARFAESNRRLFDEFVWEIAYRAEDRLANPIEYIEMRRRTGGTPWSADLVEHALGRELAPGIVASPPIRLLRDVFADTVGLHNDIVSYEKEIVVEGDRNNGVHIVGAFLGCELQAAVELVNDIITSRLQTFECTASTEIAPLIEAHGLGPSERADVLRYVVGLQEWMAGDRGWHMSSGRYGHAGSMRGGLSGGPAGLGTAAARVAALRPSPEARWQVAAAPTLPTFYMPYAARVSPHLAGARERGRAWARKLGMLTGDVWDERRLDTIDSALLAALTHPDAGADELDLINHWNTWGFYADDLFVELFKRGRALGPHDIAAAKALAGRLSALMPEDPAVAPRPGPNPLERGLADLWSRMPSELSASARRRLAAAVRTMSGISQWELRHLAAKRVPDAVEYIELRRGSIGAPFSRDIGRYVRSPCVLLPQALLATRPLRELLSAQADWQGLYNDIVSYAREQAYDRDTNTGVLVVGRLLRCDPQRAMDTLNDLVTARVRQFERIVARELDPLLDDLELAGPARADVHAYVRELQDWMAGAHEWSQSSGRYGQRDWRGDAAARAVARVSGAWEG